MAGADRADLIARFDRGDVQVLTNCMVLTEGFDSQPVGCIGILRPMLHKGTFIQAVGRGLRKVDPQRYPGIIKTDWFELREARLHLAPYTHPRFPIAVASATSPAGVLAAGKYGVGLLALGAGLPGGPQKLADYWKMGEAEAAKHGQTMDRANWKLVVNMHCAEDDERAFRDVRRGEELETLTYFSETLGRPPMRSENPLADGLKAGTTLVGSPETIAKGIERLLEFTQGGCGGILFRSHEWANREDTWRSYELFARWVMPRFQGSLRMPQQSRDWCSENRHGIFGPSIGAIRKAFTDAGQEVPDHMRLKLHTGKVDVPQG